MSKNLYKQEIGGDGAEASLDLDGGSLKLSVVYPVAKLAQPVLDVVDAAINRLEAAVPGDWDKAVLEPIREAAKLEIVKLLSE